MKIKHAWIRINARECSLIRYSKVELRGNEIWFYYKNELIFKVWLDKDDYTDLFEASKSVKINLCDEKTKKKIIK